MAWPVRAVQPGLPRRSASKPPWPIGVILRRDKPRMPVPDAFLAALTDHRRSLKEVEEALRGRRARPGLPREHPLEQGRARQAPRLVSGGRRRVPERPRCPPARGGQTSRRAPQIEANGSLRSAGSRGESEATQMNRGGPGALQARVLPRDPCAACAAHIHSRPGKRWAPRSGWRGEPSRRLPLRRDGSDAGPPHAGARHHVRARHGGLRARAEALSPREGRPPDAGRGGPLPRAVLLVRRLQHCARGAPPGRRPRREVRARTRSTSGSPPPDSATRSLAISSRPRSTLPSWIFALMEFTVLDPGAAHERRA